MKYILFYFAAVVTACVAALPGHVENFRVTDFGSGYIELAWDFVDGDPAYELHKYSLTTDSDLTTEFKCNQPICSHKIQYLEACVEHVFDLMPMFYDPSGTGDINGDLATATGYTTDELPGPVSNIRMTADNDDATTLDWDPPSLNPDCVDVYKVCFSLDGATFCVETNSTEVTVKGLVACAEYNVKVTPYTPSGLEGPPFENENITTRDGVPGKPQDVEVGLITPETIQLLWNDPIENPLCLDKFFITIGEAHAKTVRPAGRKAGGFDNEFTFTPLDPCTNYTIDVSSANSAEVASEKVTRSASTDETDPLAPPTVTVTPSGPDSIEVSWGDNENDRCAGSFVVCWIDGVHPFEQCQQVGGDGDNNLIVHDLLPCSNYNVSVTVQSPDGIFTSDSTSNVSSTPDVRPGPVVDLHVIDVDTDRMTVRCLPPAVDPQCVKEVITRVIDEDQKALRFEKKSQYEVIITGLEPCTNYRIVVTTKSPSGLESEMREVRNMTLDDVPSEPQELAVNEVTTNSVTLQWFRPATNPNCASDYTLMWSDGASTGTIEINNVSTFKVVSIVEGLQPCKDYTFIVYAESSAGAGLEATLKQATAC